MKIIVPLLFGLSVGPVSADCPAGRDIAEELVRIVSDMKAAPSEASARQYSAAMWELWLQAPDDRAQFMLDKGMAFRNIGDYQASRDELSLLIEYCPTYPEAYNQRAFAAFLAGDFEGSLEDLNITLDLQPVHLGALTGKVFALNQLDRSEEAQQVLRFALDINPWLAERALLVGEDVLEGDAL